SRNRRGDGTGRAAGRRDGDARSSPRRKPGPDCSRPELAGMAPGTGPGRACKLACKAPGTGPGKPARRAPGRACKLACKAPGMGPGKLARRAPGKPAGRPGPGMAPGTGPRTEPGKLERN